MNVQEHNQIIIFFGDNGRSYRKAAEEFNRRNPTWVIFHTTATASVIDNLLEKLFCELEKKAPKKKTDNEIQGEILRASYSNPR